MKPWKIKPMIIKGQIILLLFGTIMYCSEAITIEKTSRPDFKVDQNTHIEEKRKMSKDDIHVQSRAVIIKEGHILLCKTTGLDPDFYFLPGGHIEHGESAKSAMYRELKEEIGFEFKINRFLGCLEYSFDPKVKKHAKCHTHEYNFIFEANSSLLPAPHVVLKQFEKHIKIVWVPINQLERIDLRPEALKIFIPKWLYLDLDSALESRMEG